MSRARKHCVTGGRKFSQFLDIPDWLCMKALRDRWEEELILVEHEMGWTLEFFLFKASMWLTRLTSNGDALPEGHKCYAIRQAHMYQELAKHAQASFIKTNPTFQPIS
ncbi:hypothetical protein DFJ58DRAFT_671826 [Suillus subalutaceus]|uniref:uncharacterized protein n=1 Tax=Suillus subalutaceus TaxID=48586 RepID=UPI001B874115|nr:uncharacterized protein DFJ58DRAFT_671826 [Suillus subalutaceus]KAG1829559.1 hypothetical protein DFJ58DRAFT_671826 [Suillus subalutaceus]